MKIKKTKKLTNKSSHSGAKKKTKKSNKTIPTQLPEQDFEENYTESCLERSYHNDDEDTDSCKSDLDPVEHKKSLKKLKDIDPDFYTYLKENDRNLLEFDVSDNNESDGDDNFDGSYKSEAKHIPSDKLEVASDDDDYDFEETENGTSSSTRVTLQLLKTWQEDIQRDKTPKTIKCVVEAFHAALQTISESQEEERISFKVEGSAVFNGVVQLCVLNLSDAFKRYLKIGSESTIEAHKCKRFTKVKGILRCYLTDLIKILQNVTSSNIQSVLLKHLHQMLPYTHSFSSMTKTLVKILLKLWTSGEESVRVIAFMCILRIATSHRESILEALLKAMYFKYVENSKFVSPTTLPGINFMRHSLVEIYLLDNNRSYQHAFLYIRQLAIHLRNAMTLKRKENFQAVYNWQYINSLRFWSELICSSKSESMLHSLLYPLVQIIIGTLKLIPTAQYYPLRFHCVQMLTNISRETDTFIPILPFLLEVLATYDFNKKHKTVSMKALSLICILRMSKSQLQENGFKNSVIDTIYQLILENAAKDSHRIYFPDLYISCIIQLKAFLKKCHNANYCRKMKQLLQKIEDNRKYIENERAKVVIDIKNTPEIMNWENKIKREGTALEKFYESWIKIYQSQKLKLLTGNDEIADYKLPIINKSGRRKRDEESTTNGKDEGSVDSADEESEIQDARVRKTKRKKIKNKNSDGDDETETADIVRDTNTDDWD